jgi:polysaccharide biosynthesis transport protein
LEKFRSSQDLVDPELQARSLVDSLSTLQKEQQQNRGQLAALQTQFGALQAQLGRSPQQAAVAARLSQSQRVQSMMNEIQAAEANLMQQRLRFTDRTPQIQVLSENLQNLRAQLSMEASKVIGNTPATSADAQLGQTDQKFVNDLIEAQVGFMAAQAREQTLSATEARIRSELKRFPTLLAEFNRLQPNVKINRETLEQLLKARQELGLEIARGAMDWQVIEEPRLGRKVGPSWLRNLLAGSVVGLMLGSLAAFMRDSQDDSVRSSEDLAKQTPLPLLGMVPELPLPEVAALPINFPFQRPASFDPSMLQVLHWAPFRESLDLIYKNLQLLTDGSPMKSLVITSALAGEGKSTVALGLAISAARLHQRVLLIDADLRRPGLHKQLELPNDQGLATLLTSDRLPSHGAIQHANTYSDLPISVLTAGPTPMDSVKLLSSNRMRELMNVFEQNYDLVIVDAPPVLGIVDAILAASFCDGALLVGRMGHVNRQEVAQAAATMNRLNLVGIIANGATPMSNYYYSSAMG